MAIQGIESAVQQLHRAASQAAGNGSDAPVTGGSFAEKLSAALDNISDSQNKATMESQAYATGNSPLGLNDVMVDMQKSSIALQTGVQVRNKMVAAYQDIMNMSM
ncbi:flagellar hook-basal body complex protein FliE [Sodalis ligni]|uniref:flagellar hook-basal body complex protein FliE n=1 Tax=Sodalis ligni TaxID=2697027 RepID=UPI00193F161F|nr:flagellar hook-basal body complex protein FliE [Sodalis ligni]QWA09064.1 flagellar hook-basal body complex protein FliE [Sodalis ligni]